LNSCCKGWLLQDLNTPGNEVGSDIVNRQHEGTKTKRSRLKAVGKYLKTKKMKKMMSREEGDPYNVNNSAQI
jgi:hypothetical protein